MNDAFEKFLDLAKQGRLTDEQANIVATELQKPNPRISRYTLLHILGRGGKTAYRDLVETFLED